jgi:predicted  nucleic acid-binding Zn-ribbon protein
MSRSANLMRLQAIDSQINNKLNRVAEIEKLLSNKDELIEIEKLVLAAEKHIADIRKQLLQAENNVRDQQLKIELTDNALYGGKVRNPKELQDLQNEAAALRRYLSVLEDRQIDAMITLEEAETQHQSAIINYERIKTKYHHQNETLSIEHLHLNDDLIRLNVEREVVLQTIDKQDLELYEKLRENRRGIAIASIIEQTCGACGTTLTPAVRQSAQSPVQIVQCPSCRRILYSS